MNCRCPVVCRVRPFMFVRPVTQQRVMCERSDCILDVRTRESECVVWNGRNYFVLGLPLISVILWPLSWRDWRYFTDKNKTKIIIIKNKQTEESSWEHSSIIYFLTLKNHHSFSSWKFIINFQQHSFAKCKVTIQIFNRKKNKLTVEFSFFF